MGADETVRRAAVEPRWTLHGLVDGRMDGWKEGRSRWTCVSPAAVLGDKSSSFFFYSPHIPTAASERARGWSLTVSQGSDRMHTVCVCVCVRACVCVCTSTQAVL
jgi:hypothetical protein